MAKKKLFMLVVGDEGEWRYGEFNGQGT